jgi:hypothetical protein
MLQSLNWIDVLNEHAEWTKIDDLKAWLTKILGHKPDLDKASIDAFDETLNFMRRQVSALHFNQDIEEKKIDTRLKSVKLGFGQGKNSFVPILHARPDGSNDAAVLHSLEDTLFVQFAFFAAQCLSGETVAGINRCEGLYREETVPGSVSKNFSYEHEKRWRKEIPLLEKASDNDDIQRCADFFIVKPKSRFCSETCRFRTFQINKQLTDPDYLADKQRRYRARK